MIPKTISGNRRLLFSFLFLTQFAVMAMAHDDASLVTDTSHIASLIKKAKTATDDHPDSALYYYRLALKSCSEALPSARSGSLRDQIIRKSIQAESGTGLILYDRLENGKALECYGRALASAKKLNDHHYIAESLFNIAEVYLEQSKYTLAMTKYFEALNEYRNLKDEDGAYWCYIGMGIVQKRCGNYADAIICYEKARTIADQSGMQLEAAYCYNNLGVVCYRQGNFKKAMEYYEKALTCFTRMKDDPSASDCMNNIANVYLDQGNPKRALEYLNRSIGFEKVKKDDYRMISRYTNMSDAYVALKDYKNALLYIEKGIKLAEKSEDRMMQAATYSLAGNVQFKNGSKQKGLDYFQKAVNMFHSIGSRVEEAEGLVDLANAEQSAGQLNDALTHASQAEILADSLHVNKTSYAVYNCLSGLWEKKGDPARSLRYLKQASQLKDSIFSAEKNRAIEEIEAGFTRTRLENENQILQQKEKLQAQSLRIRNIALISLSVFLIFSVLIIWLIYKRHLDAKVIAQHKEELKQKEIDRLNENLLYKERELTSKTVFITQKNNLLKKMIEEFDALKEEPGKLLIRIPQLQHELKLELSPNTWKEFEMQFNEVHPEFQTNLLEKFPELTPMERRLCAFLRLDMNTREIASLTGQTFKSIEVARTRIRKKMDLTHEENLANFIASI